MNAKRRKEIGRIAAAARWGKPRDLTGTRFGRLVVLGLSRRKPISNRIRFWRCQCDCGKKTVANYGNLTQGISKSCGCARLKHGASFTVEYRTWHAIRQRCANPRTTDYQYYGWLGISVCDRWNFGEDGKKGFVCFLEDMGPRPSSQHSIDRVDNDGDYEPRNCRWATPTEQCSHLRPRKRNSGPQQ